MVSKERGKSESVVFVSKLGQSTMATKEEPVSNVQKFYSMMAES